MSGAEEPRFSGLRLVDPFTVKMNGLMAKHLPRDCLLRSVVHVADYHPRWGIDYEAVNEEAERTMARRFVDVILGSPRKKSIVSTHPGSIDDMDREVAMRSRGPGHTRRLQAYVLSEDELRKFAQECYDEGMRGRKW